MMEPLTNNDEQLKSILINSYSFGNNEPGNGYLLINVDREVIHANEFCCRYFDLDGSLLPVNSQWLFNELNANAISKINGQVFDKKLLQNQNEHIIAAIHEVVFKNNIPVTVIFYVLYDNKVISLSGNFVPLSNSSGVVRFVQVFFSQYDFWGWTDIFSMSQESSSIRQNYMYLGDHSALPIKLSPRQQEIVFLLSLGAGMRQVAEVLKIQYGTLTGALRNSIYPKFNILDNDANKFIGKAIALGYNAVIPQSLCRPLIVILDSRIREQYFKEL